MQTPPIYSALKHKGTPLYKLARNKELEVEELEKIIKEKSKTVTLHELTLLSYDPPYFTFKAHVSKGTYIRSLANDIARKIDSCATTYELERTQIGPLPLAKAIPFATIKTTEDVITHLLNEKELIGLLT